jgi:hypothetical protein
MTVSLLRNVSLLSLLSAFVFPMVSWGGGVAAKAQKGPMVNVKVEAPPGISPMDADDIEDAFYDELFRRFESRGLAGRTTQVTWRNEEEVRPSLEVNIFRWRRDRMGDIECVVSATWTDAGGKVSSLGIHRGRVMSITRSPGGAFLGHDFEKAASEAADSLLRRLEKDGLVTLPAGV